MQEQYLMYLVIYSSFHNIIFLSYKWYKKIKVGNIYYFIYIIIFKDSAKLKVLLMCVFIVMSHLVIVWNHIEGLVQNYCNSLYKMR